MKIQNWSTVRDVESLVYFIHNKRTGLTKIGRTSNILQRMSVLFGGEKSKNVTVLLLIKTPSPVSAERYFHFIFRTRRVFGEWFDLLSGDVDYVSAFVGGGGKIPDGFDLYLKSKSIVEKLLIRSIEILGPNCPNIPSASVLNNGTLRSAVSILKSSGLVETTTGASGETKIVGFDNLASLLDAVTNDGVELIII